MMAWRFLAVLLFLGHFPFTTEAGVRCELGTEEVPSICSYSLPTILKVVIRKNGASSQESPESVDDCKRFMLTEGQVRKYFRLAGRTGPEVHYYKQYFSPCFASGIFELAQGKTARWHISGVLTGVLEIDDKKPIELLCDGCEIFDY